MTQGRPSALGLLVRSFMVTLSRSFPSLLLMGSKKSAILGVICSFPRLISYITEGREQKEESRVWKDMCCCNAWEGVTERHFPLQTVNQLFEGNDSNKLVKAPSETRKPDVICTWALSVNRRPY